MGFKSVEAGEGSTPEAPSIKVELNNGEVHECDLLLSATGRSANTQGFGIDVLEKLGLKVAARGKLIEVDKNGWTGVGRIYAVGDCATGSMGLATMGQAQATRAVRAMFSAHHISDDMNVKPFGVWTIPEIAWAGMTEAAAKKAEINHSSAIVPFGRTMKGCVTGEDGFLKMVFDKKTGVILGIHLCGEYSCELVNYGAQIVNCKSTIFETLNFVFPAVTYHVLYNNAAAEAKIRFLGANDLAAATAWKRVKGLVQMTLQNRTEGNSALTPAQALIDAFREFDEDDSGFLSDDELFNALNSLGLDITMEEVKDMITEAMGEEGRKDMDYQAFLKVLSSDGTGTDVVADPKPDRAEMEARRASRTPLRLMQRMSSCDSYELIVLGAGPVGLRAAQEAASRGKRVALIDPKAVLTGAPTGAHSKCLREAVLHGAKTWAEVQEQVASTTKLASSAAARTIRTFHISVMKGTGSIVDEGKIRFQAPGEEDRVLQTEAILICTGSKSNRFPPTKFDIPGVYDSDTIWGIDRIPKSLVVQGAGIVSVEYALIFAKLGSKVKVIDAFDVFLPMIDVSLQESCRAMLEKNGVEVIMGTPFKSVDAVEGSTTEAPAIRIDVGERGVFECDCLLSACGRHGNTTGIGIENLAEKGVKVAARGKLIEVDDNGWTGFAKVYAAGDCATGSMGLATMGTAQGTRAARAMFTQAAFVSTEKKKDVKPFGVWTIPEIAWAGISEQQAIKQGKNFGVTKAEYKQTVKGCVHNEDGFLKLLWDRDSGVVLGVHLCGENACELVNYGCEVVNGGQTIFQMLHFVFPAVTMHNLYYHAAAEGKIRFLGAKDLAAATTWKRVRGIIKKGLKGDQVLHEVLDEVFKGIDEDNSGFLSKAELKQAMEQMNIQVTDEEVQAMVEEAMGDEEHPELDYKSFIKMAEGTQLETGFAL